MVRPYPFEQGTDREGRNGDDCDGISGREQPIAQPLRPGSSSQLRVELIEIAGRRYARPTQSKADQVSPAPGDPGELFERDHRRSEEEQHERCNSEEDRDDERERERPAGGGQHTPDRSRETLH